MVDKKIISNFLSLCYDAGLFAFKVVAQYSEAHSLDGAQNEAEL